MEQLTNEQRNETDMKLLKETTLKAYSRQRCTSALLRHLDRLSDFVSQYNETETAPLRIDMQFGTVFKYDFDANCYRFECTTEDKSQILDLISKYSAHVKFIINLDTTRFPN